MRINLFPPRQNAVGTWSKRNKACLLWMPLSHRLLIQIVYGANRTLARIINENKCMRGTRCSVLAVSNGHGYVLFAGCIEKHFNQRKLRDNAPVLFTENTSAPVIACQVEHANMYLYIYNSQFSYRLVLPGFKWHRVFV